MTDPRPDVWLDHFVVGIHELSEGSRAFETLTGVKPQFGGEHPTLGTHNVLASLGRRAYLEILAPRPDVEVHPLFAPAGGHRVLTPYLIALATDDIEGVHRRLAAAGFEAPAPGPGSRLTDDGERLSWSMFSLHESGPAGAPFFIQWDLDSPHPATTTPAGCTVAGFEIASPDAHQLRKLFVAIEFEVSIRKHAGDTAAMRVHLATPGGRVTLPGRDPADRPS